MGHLSQPSRKNLKQIKAVYRSLTDRYTVYTRLMYYYDVTGYMRRVVMFNYGDLRLWIMFECQDAPFGGHGGRRKTYITFSLDFYLSWPVYFASK